MHLFRALPGAKALEITVVLFSMDELNIVVCVVLAHHAYSRIRADRRRGCRPWKKTSVCSGEW
jgi:hypothetical protein